MSISKLPKVKKLKPHVAHDEILSEFLKTFYIISTSDKAFTYADDLYSNYKTFYLNKYGNSPLQLKEFVRKIKLTGKFEYKRPHISRNSPNKWAFMNLKVREKLIEEINSQITKPDFDIQELNAFSEYLVNITYSIQRDIK